MLIIAKQMRPAPPAPRIPPPSLRPRTPHLRCAVKNAPPDRNMPPSDEDTSSSEDEEEQDKIIISTAHSVPDYDEQAYSTHSKPQRRSEMPQHHDKDYIPRRLTGPGTSPVQAPSPMRAAIPERTSPVAIRTTPLARRASSQSLRKKLRSTQQNIRKRKESSPQRMITRDCEETLMSPVRSFKISRKSKSPPKDAVPPKDANLRSTAGSLPSQW